MKHLNSVTYDPTDKICFEPILDDVSETIPNQSFSIQEIITRFTGGIMPTITKRVYYDDNADFDSVDPTLRPDYDLTDAYSRLSELSDEFEQRKNKDEPEPTPAPIPETKDEPDLLTE